MVAFPQLEPFRRGWSFGEYGMTEEPVWASVPVRFRHGRGSTQNVGQVLSLSFVDLYEEEVDLIRAHYVSRDGGTLAFSLPSIVWAGLTAPPVPSTVSWVYQDVPVEVQKSGGLYDVTLSLLSVVAAGDGGGSVFADGFTETITLSFFGGAATSAQEGIRETVTVSLVGGEAIEALNGLRQTVAVTLAAGAADGGAGNAAGAAFTVNVSLASGAGTSEVAGAALTVTVSLAAGEATAGDPDPEIGDAYAGGYFAGYFSESANGVATHRLIVAPADTGASGSGYPTTTGLRWKTTATVTAGANSIFDGPANMAAIETAGIALHPAAEFCANLTIDGYSDWYLPSRVELQIAYENLKPTTASNTTNVSTIHGYGVPTRTSAYTTTVPARTSLSLFQSGGAQAFVADNHWSSNQVTGGFTFNQGLNFASGAINNLTITSTTVRTRAFRKEPI
jgi:hypothetical protein